MTAPTTLAGMIQEINSSNLQDGQQIKQLLLDIVTYVGTAGGAVVTAQAPTTALTDSSGGTSGGNTIPAVTNPSLSVGADTTAANGASTIAAVTALKNDISTLSAKQNAVIAALVAAGVMT
jgi:hypothetical protein